MFKTDIQKAIIAEAKNRGIDESLIDSLKIIVPRALNKVEKRQSKKSVRVQMLVPDPDIIKVIQDVSTSLNVSIENIKSSNRFEELVIARQITIYTIKETYGNRFSLACIGAHLGGLDHTTVSHHLKNATYYVQANDSKFMKYYCRYKAYVLTA